ncbi:hypothetical protein COB64_01545 [Candidatus Wolfebacteria bacterium]|nr:MAG: hypothetical protein COB64_01545 [Candidatus Wolfebacteria bacterium]
MKRIFIATYGSKTINIHFETREILPLVYMNPEFRKVIAGQEKLKIIFDLSEQLFGSRVNFMASLYTRCDLINSVLGKLYQEPTILLVVDDKDIEEIIDAIKIEFNFEFEGGSWQILRSDFNHELGDEWNIMNFYIVQTELRPDVEEGNDEEEKLIHVTPTLEPLKRCEFDRKTNIRAN